MMSNKNKYLVLALTGMLAANAMAENVKDKGTATNVAFNKSFTPTEYTLEGKPNVLVISMDDLGYG